MQQGYIVVRSHLPLLSFPIIFFQRMLWAWFLVGSRRSLWTSLLSLRAVITSLRSKARFLLGLIN